ncbi:MAG TPA: PHP domain-containing protein [Patescibacteria group bacterium]|nr:PHP domain-containing protein [Patescibacteria group bacterium]
MYIDFHTHTIASDGRLTPTALIKKAKALGFGLIAKTDHDNVNLMPEFISAGKKFGIQAIPGMEISSRYLDKSLHIIALNIDYQNKKINWYAEQCIAARKIRGLKMADKLAINGWQLKKSELNHTLLARPHVALAVINHPKNKKRLLQEFGLLPDFSTFIKKYLAKNCPCYVPKKYYLRPLPAITMIHAAGGLAIIAHPACKTKEFSYSRAHLSKIIKNLPFDGLEVYSRDNTPAETTYLKSLAAKHHLLISAGSDYHGYDKEFPLGVKYRGKLVNTSYCTELIEKLNS